MAVLSKIRNKVGLVIGFVGASMLLFILGDVLTSSNGLFGRNKNVLGEVGGEKITYPEFESRVEKMIDNYKAQSQKDNLDENTTEMIREQAWNNVLNENILGRQYKALGISCTPEELYDMCTGNNVHPQVRQAFTDPKTGVFNPADVVKTLKDLPNRPENVQQQWHTFETALHDERISEKYKNIIKGGLYVTKAEARDDYYDKSRTANIRFFQLSYMSIPDSTVKVEDSDLESYYSAHKKEYEQKESVRKIDYVVFDVAPSAEDRQEVVKWINEKHDAFATTDNDTLFVNQYSDTPFDSSFHTKGTLSMALDSTFFSAPVGTLTAPYEEGGIFKVSKLMAARNVPDSVKVSHALISYKGAERAGQNVTRSYAEAKSRADSLFKLAQTGEAKYLEIARTASDDIVSAAKDGDLGWLNRNSSMDPQFKAGYMSMHKGNTKLVESPFGFHIIHVSDEAKGQQKEIQVATVQRAVEASQKTFDASYNKAQKFVSENPEGDKFDSTVAKMGLSKRSADNLRESEKYIAGLDKPREIVRWAFTAKLNELSKVFSLGDKFVVAKLTGIRDKGILPLDQVRDQVMTAVRKEKKGAMLAEKINSQSAGASFEALGQKMNQGIFPAGNVSFGSPYVQGMGNEPKVIGQIFALKKGQVSKPIIGDNGVFVVIVDMINEPAKPTDVTSNQKQIADSRRQRSDYEVFNALKEKAGVVDNRGRFY